MVTGKLDELPESVTKVVGSPSVSDNVTFTEVASPSDTASTALYVQFRCAKTQLKLGCNKKTFFAPNAEHTPHKAAALQENSHARGHSPLIASKGARTKKCAVPSPIVRPSHPPISHARPRALPVSCRGGALTWHLHPPTVPRSTFYPCKRRSSRGDSPRLGRRRWSAAPPTPSQCNKASSPHLHIGLMR